MKGYQIGLVPLFNRFSMFLADGHLPVQDGKCGYAAQKNDDFRIDDCQLPEEMSAAVGDIRIGWGPSTGQILNRAGDEDLFFFQTDLPDQRP